MCRSVLFGLLVVAELTFRKSMCVVSSLPFRKKSVFRVVVAEVVRVRVCRSAPLTCSQKRRATTRPQRPAPPAHRQSESRPGCAGVLTCCVVIFVLEGLVGTLRCLVCSIQLTFSQKTERHVVPPGLHYTT